MWRTNTVCWLSAMLLLSPVWAAEEAPTTTTEVPVEQPASSTPAEATPPADATTAPAETPTAPVVEAVTPVAETVAPVIEPAASIYQQDFEFFWQTIAANYAYFDIKQTDWDKAKTFYSDAAAKVTTKSEFIGLLEKALDEFYDPHMHLNTNTDMSPPLLPSGTDLWAQWDNGSVFLTQVRHNSAAAKAGLRAGQRIMSVNGVNVADAVKARLGQHLKADDPAAMNWAATAAVAGQRDKGREFFILANGITRSVSVPVSVNETPRTALTFKRFDDIGYIRIENSLGSSDLIAHFDSTLALLRDTKGLILDLRNTPSGGNTTVARAILSRFIDHDMPYQKHVLPMEEKNTGVKRSWLELASPRGSFVYRAPVAVLVDHWTGSMGEGLAIGLNATIKAPLIGTEMAHLLGAIESFSLPNSGIRFNLPVEKLFHVNDTPREQVIPTQRLPDIAGEKDYTDAAIVSLRKMQRGEAPTQTGSQR